MCCVLCVVVMQIILAFDCFFPPSSAGEDGRRVAFVYSRPRTG